MNPCSTCYFLVTVNDFDHSHLECHGVAPVYKDSQQDCWPRVTARATGCPGWMPVPKSIKEVDYLKPTGPA
jgi:hypothetical protein